MEYIRLFDESLNSSLNEYIRKPTLIKGVVHLLLVLYAVRLAPELPKEVLELFKNQYFKLFIFSLILWTASFSPSTSILIAIAFMVTVNYATKKPLWEFLDNVEPIIAPSVAVRQLADAAVSSTASNPENVVEVANVAVSSVKTPIGAEAVKTLAEAAMSPISAPPDLVGEVASIAITSMKETPAPEPAPAPAPAPAPEPAPAPAPAPVPEPAPAPAPAPAQPKEQLPTPAPVPEGMGCYPLRR